MHDLFAIAENNRQRTEESCNGKLASLPLDQRDKAKEFKQWVCNQTHVSINMSLEVMARLINGESYLNAYEVAKLRGMTVEAHLHENDKHGYADKRIEFDKHFLRSDQFKYAALNGGCAGLYKYFEPYCVVLKPDFQQSLENVKPCACLPGNSLKRYFNNPSNKFEVKQLTEEVVPLSHRHHTVTQHRLTEIIASPKKHRQRLVLSDAKKSYFELIFIADVVFDNLHSIRVKHRKYYRHQKKADKLREAQENGISLTDDKEVFLKSFDVFFECVKNRKIALRCM